VNEPVLSLGERLDVHPDYAGAGVCIAFVDSGFVPHPDLIRPTTRVRAFVDTTRDKPEVDDFLSLDGRVWHGTMTACCAAGNGYLSRGRYRGIAHRSAVALLACRAGARAPLRGKDVAAAMRFPLRHPELQVRIVNVSLGVDADDPDAAEVVLAAGELDRAGILVVAAAGNQGGAKPSPPASAEGVLAVGGVDDNNTRSEADDELWAASSACPHLLAPATRLPAPMVQGTLVAREAPHLFKLLDVLEETESDVVFRKGRPLDPSIASEASLARTLEAVRARIAHQKFISVAYQHVDGTSFAAPIVSAIAAQMLEACGSLGPADLREGLRSTCRPLDGVPVARQGAGVVQPRRAVEWAIARRPRVSL